MAIGVYAMVRDCCSCPSNHVYGQNKRQLKLFFTDRSLQYLRVDILEPVPKTKKGHQFVFVMTEGHIMLTKAIPTLKTNTGTASRIFLEHLAANFVFFGQKYLRTIAFKLYPSFSWFCAARSA